MKRNIVSFMVGGLTIAGVAALAVSSALAASGTIGATVDIIQPVTVTPGVSLDFGTLTAPTSGTETWTYPAATNTLSLTTGSESVSLGGEVLGSFTVGGESGEDADLAVAFTDFTAGPVTLVSVDIFPTGTITLGGTPTDIAVGGVLDLDANGTSGTYGTAIVTLTANY